MKILFLTIIFAVVLFFPKIISSQISFKKIKMENYCRLFEKTENDEKAVFRTKALMIYSNISRVDGGDSFIYLPDCNNGDYFAVTNFSNFRNAKKWSNFIGKLPLERNYIFELDLTGSLHISVIPIYGHLSWSRAEIEILQIDSFKDVSSTNKIQPDYEAEKRLTEKGQQLQLINSEVMFSLLGSNKNSSIKIEDYLADDFKVFDVTVLIANEENYKQLIAGKLFDEMRDYKSIGVKINSVSKQNADYKVSGIVLWKNEKTVSMKYENIFLYKDENWLLKETKFFKN